MKWQKFTNISLKVTIVILIIHALIYPELAQYQEKGMKYRIIGYPLAAFAIFLARRAFKIRTSFPYSTDILISSVITLDMLGNALGFYGSIEWWDDAMHLVNCALLTPVAINAQPHRLNESRLIILINAIGLITWMQVLWEIAEYVSFITTNSKELSGAYRDTIGDLAYGQLGILIALFAIWCTKRYSRS